MEKRSFLYVCALTASFYLVNNYVFDKTPTNIQTEQTTTAKASSSTASDSDTKPFLVSYSSNDSGEYYVLENDYQQVVISTTTGSIAEINLPFQTDKNDKSIVLPIGFDKKILNSSPENAQFPLKPYYAFENGKSVKKEPKQGGYSPLLRRSLKANDNTYLSQIPANAYALNILSDNPNEALVTYSVKNFGKDFIELVGKGQTRTISKTIRLKNDIPYTIEMAVKVDGSSENLWITSGILEAELVSGAYTPMLQYYKNSSKEALEKIKLPKADSATTDANSLWVSNSNGFFGLILDPINQNQSTVKANTIPGQTAPSRLSLIDKEYNLYPAKDYPAYSLMIPYKQTSDVNKFVVYSGPYSTKMLKIVDKALLNPETGTGSNPNFVKVSAVQGWTTFITEPFSNFLFLLMQFFHLITRSWGFSIILLTFVLRLMLYPLNAWAYKSNAKMQKLGPKLSQIQEKFKSDPKRLQMETAMLYKTEGVNPFSGCLPMLIQFPFLIGMFDLLKSTFELRGVGFIPGWITNLTSPDVLFSWGYPIIFLGTSFHLLPFILGGLMYLQSKVGMMQQKDKGPLTDQQKQMQSAGNIMTVVFTFMFYNMPSGLNIYWIFSTLFGMLQQWYMVQNFNKNPNVLKKQ
jgi:YidC/Oxa1 family membrane protein insertase